MGVEKRVSFMTFKICSRIDYFSSHRRILSGCHLVAAAGMIWCGPENLNFRALELALTSMLLNIRLENLKTHM